MRKLKNLANCTPREFLTQTNKIRKSVAKWLTLTDIQNIRKRKPSFVGDKEQDENALKQQALDNWNAILDSVMEQHPDETLEILALVCFVDPKDVDKHSMSEYLGAMNEVLNDENVMGFFTSLIATAQKIGLEA